MSIKALVELEAKLVALYEAFEDVRKPRSIPACSCCLDQRQIARLLATPLRKIERDDLSPYASSAFLTVGSVADYLYFLPRIMEVSCEDASWWPDIEVTGRAISESNLDGWPEHRRQALIGVISAMVDRILEVDDGGFEIDDWVCGIAKMGLDVTPYLVRIQQSPFHVLAFYERNARQLPKNKLGNSFWDQGDAGYDTVVKWFKSPDVSAVIMDGYGLHP